MYELILQEKKVSSDNFIIIQFKGEVDNTCVNTIQKKIDSFVSNMDEKYLIFDFTYLSYVNSQFMGYIISLSNDLIDKDKVLTLACAQPQILDVMDNLGLMDLVNYESNIENLVNSLI